MALSPGQHLAGGWEAPRRTARRPAQTSDRSTSLRVLAPLPSLVEYLDVELSVEDHWPNNSSCIGNGPTGAGIGLYGCLKGGARDTFRLGFKQLRLRERRCVFEYLAKRKVAPLYVHNPPLREDAKWAPPRRAGDPRKRSAFQRPLMLCGKLGPVFGRRNAAAS